MNRPDQVDLFGMDNPLQKWSSEGQLIKMIQIEQTLSSRCIILIK